MHQNMHLNAIVTNRTNQGCWHCNKYVHFFVDRRPTSNYISSISYRNHLDARIIHMKVPLVDYFSGIPSDKKICLKIKGFLEESAYR